MENLNLLHEELAKLEIGFDLTPLLDFIFRLEDGDFTKKGSSWVYEPNFVVLNIHSERARNITLDLRGNVFEFPPFAHLPLAQAQNGYSRCKIEGILQFDAALVYIRYAHKFWKEGRDRIKRERKIVEI